MSIAAALVEATHHSAPRSEWPGTHQAPRGQKTTSAQVDPTCFDLFDEEDVGGGRPGALPVLPAPQEALPRPGARTLTSPPVCVPKLEEDAVAWEVVEGRCFAEPAILYEFRGEWEEIGRGVPCLFLGAGTLRFFMAGEVHEVLWDAAPYWELKVNAGSERTICWKVPDRSAGFRGLAVKFASKQDALIFSSCFPNAREICQVRRAVAASRGVG